MKCLRDEMTRKNKEYSLCVEEVEKMFHGWVCSSGYDDEKIVIEELKKNISIEYKDKGEFSECSIKCSDKPIGVPFVSASNSNVDIKNFKTDLFLLLLYIGNKVGGESQKYIENFVAMKQK